MIRDLPALATMLGWGESELTSHPLPFTDNDGVIAAPWDTRLKIVTRAAKLNADKLLRYIANAEDEDRRQAMYGKTYGRGKDSWYVPPEICADTTEVSPGSVDRAIRSLSGIRRAKGIPTTVPARDGTSPMCAAGPGFFYVAFVVDVFAQRIVAWHASTSKATELVMTRCGWRCGNATAASKSRAD
ncbi:hypothetical protein [Tamaricihabitans halophyticus]|uniref:hypothetical protein n=1 Tax=Tamaricihabitans halophyticus TaxID=1262583 RepID=UPI001042C236